MQRHMDHTPLHSLAAFSSKQPLASDLTKVRTAAFTSTTSYVLPLRPSSTPSHLQPIMHIYGLGHAQDKSGGDLAWAEAADMGHCGALGVIGLSLRGTTERPGQGDGGK